MKWYDFNQIQVSIKIYQRGFHRIMKMNSYHVGNREFHRCGWWMMQFEWYVIDNAREMDFSCYRREYWHVWDDLGNLLVCKYLTLHTNTKIDTTIDLSYVYLKYIYTDDTKFEMSKKKN